MNHDLLLKVQQLNPSPPASDLPDGVRNAAEALEHLDDLARTPGDRRRLRSQPIIAVAVAAAVVLTFGAVNWFGRLTGSTGQPNTGDLQDSPRPTSENPARIENAPSGAESGVIDTPSGPVTWVHLSPGDSTPRVGRAVPWQSGLALFEPTFVAGLGSDPDSRSPVRLWVSADGLDWHITPLPGPEYAQGASLTYDGDGYWLVYANPSGLWRSTDGETWNEYDPAGLAPPGPTGFRWTAQFTPPVTAGDVTVSIGSFVGAFPFSDYLPFSVDRRELCVDGLRKIRAGVYKMMPNLGVGGCSGLPLLRFIEEESGLTVFDDTTGEQLGPIEGAELADLDRIADTNEELYEQRLLIFEDEQVTQVETPWPGAFNLVTLFAVDNWIYAYVADEFNGAPSAWRSKDGRSWTELGQPSFADDTATPGPIVFTALSDLVVASEAQPPHNAWTSEDGLNWTPAPEGRPDGTNPVRLESGWFATDGSMDSPFQGRQWWIHRDAAWIPLTDVGKDRGRYCYNPPTSLGNTTVFFGCQGFTWIVSTEE